MISSPPAAPSDSSHRPSCASTSRSSEWEAAPTSDFRISSFRAIRRSRSDVVLIAGQQAMGPHAPGESFRAAALFATSMLFVCALPASAQKFQNIGPRKCIDCHDHEKEKLWSEKQDGPPPMNHLNALKQMETDKTPKFAKAV